MSGGLFTSSVLPTVISSTNCNGTETELLDCDVEFSSVCSSQEHASVVCQSTYIR